MAKGEGEWEIDGRSIWHRRTAGGTKLREKV